MARYSALALAPALILGCGGPREITELFDSQVMSVNIGVEDWILGETMLLDPGRVEIALPAEEIGHRLMSAWVDGSQAELWLGFEVGSIYHSTDRGRQWQRVDGGLQTPDLLVIDLPLSQPIPREFLRSTDGTLFLATVGRGVVSFDAASQTWFDESWAFDLDGSAHPGAWVLGPRGDGDFTAGYVAAGSVVPPELSALLGGVVRARDGRRHRIIQYDLPSPVRLVTGLGEIGGAIVAATLGHGVFLRLADEWAPLGPSPAPADLAAMAINDGGAIAVVTYSGDVYWRAPGGGEWVPVRCGGNDVPARDIRFGTDGMLRVAVGSTVEAGAVRPVSCDERGGARVLLAFSQHVNLTHSVRGDTNDEEGFGKDLRVIRNTLDVFGRHPSFHNDWDIDNLFSLDGKLLDDAPDVRAAIAERVNSGADGIRLMSFNNGLLANETADELAASIDRAKASLEAFVPGAWSPGVQPQENMLTPAHLAIYRERGIDWITLFYSATAFTGFRNEVPLSLAEAHGVLQLGSPLSSKTMKLIPVYHHADILGHGGLANWLRQLHQNLEGTAVLAVHFDAGGDPWLGLDAELTEVEQMDADWVVPARLADIVSQVEPAAAITVHRDVADGAFDGFSSWTEKPANQRMYTRIARSRLAAGWARHLAPQDVVVSGFIAGAFESRLRALSTTHFGLATPDLHPAREQAGDVASSDAESFAVQALAGAVAGSTIPPRSVYNPSSTAVTFVQPIATPHSGIDPTQVGGVQSADGVRSWLTGRLGPSGIATLSSSAVPAAAATDAGVGWSAEALPFDVLGPRVRVASTDYRPTVTERAAARGDGFEVITLRGAWDHWPGAVVRYDWIRTDFDPGAWWVQVELTAPHAELTELAPLEIALPSRGTWTITRPLQTGEIASYEIGGRRDALNNHAAAGWVRVGGAAGGFSVATVEAVRAAPAFLPLRLVPTAGGTRAILAPFASLWGEQLAHRPNALLGSGVAELATRLVAPQLQPSAPAWSGESLCFLLRLDPDSPDGELGALSATRAGVLFIDATRAASLPPPCGP